MYMLLLLFDTPETKAMSPRPFNWTLTGNQLPSRETMVARQIVAMYKE